MLKSISKSVKSTANSLWLDVNEIHATDEKFLLTMQTKYFSIEQTLSKENNVSGKSREKCDERN